MDISADLAALFGEDAIPTDSATMLAFELEAAVRADDRPEASRLLAEGADPAWPSKADRFPPYFLAAQHSLDCLRLFAQSGALDLGRPVSTRTPLQHALLGGNEACARFLLPASDPNHLDSEGWDALMCATVARLPAMVETLLSVCDPRLKDEGGETALMLLMPAGDDGVAPRVQRIIDLLLPSADLMGADKYGNNLLHKCFIRSDSADILSADFIALRHIAPLMPTEAFFAANDANVRPIDFPPLRALFEKRELDRQVAASNHPAQMAGGESLAPKKAASRL